MQLHVHADPGWPTYTWPVMCRFIYNDYAYACIYSFFYTKKPI